MKRPLLSLMTIMVLLAMSLPAGTPAVMAQGAGNHTATDSAYPDTPVVAGLVADFEFVVPECPLCSGIEFTDRSTGGTEPYEYHWDFGDDSTSTDEGPLHFYDSYGSYDVTLTVTDDAGYEASATRTVDLNEPDTEDQTTDESDQDDSSVESGDLSDNQTDTENQAPPDDSDQDESSVDSGNVSGNQTDTEDQTLPDDPGQDDLSGEGGTVSGNQTDTGTPPESGNSTTETDSDLYGDSSAVSGKQTETDDTALQTLDDDQGEPERRRRGRPNATAQGAGDQTATDERAIGSSVVDDRPFDPTFAPTTTHNVTPLEKDFPRDRDCSDGGTLFKDQFKDVRTGTHDKTYSIDGQSVTVTITVYDDNTFDFDVVGGAMARLFVKTGGGPDHSGYLLYQYDPPVSGATNTGPVASDTTLHTTWNPEGTGTYRDISHLDFCIVPHTPFDARISIEKTAFPTYYTEVGNIITYTFTVTNIGNVTLTNVTVTDPLFELDFGPITLGPGEDHEFNYEYTVTQEDIDASHIFNTAFAEAWFGDEKVEDHDSETVTGPDADPDISLGKSASPSSVSTAGTTVTFTFTVENIGNVTLTGVTVTDPLPGLSTITFIGSTQDSPEGTLLPGEIATYTATYTVTQVAIAANEDIVNIATVTCSIDGVTDTATATVNITPPFTRAIYCPAGCVRYLTVDWDDQITTACLHGADQLIEDMFCPNPDAKHNLVLERGTQAPEVEGTRHYLIEVRELTAQELPDLPDDMTAVVAFRMTPVGSEFNKDIFLTLGFDAVELPDEARYVDIFFYDEGAGDWVSLGGQPAPPNGVAEISLSAPVRHFTVFAVLATSVPPASVPASFVGSDLNIVPGVDKTWSALTFVTRTGEDVTITAKVTNEGGQAGTYTADLKLNGEMVDSKTVSLGPTESQYVTFTVSGLDYGEYEVEVAGLSDTFTAFRTITWWLIIVLLAAIGLIVWGVARARRRRKARQQA